MFQMFRQVIGVTNYVVSPVQCCVIDSRVEVSVFTTPNISPWQVVVLHNWTDKWERHYLEEKVMEMVS